MPIDPLSPREVDELLRPDPRTVAADIYVLRDALHRMGSAFEELASAVEEMQQLVVRAEQSALRDDAEARRRASLPPRAD
jgi:hypothetical protein